MIKPPSSYFGGKAKKEILNWILDNFPMQLAMKPINGPVYKNIDTFVDLFGGMGSIILNSPTYYDDQVWNEKDYGIYCLFKSIKEDCENLQKSLIDIPVTKNSYKDICKWKSTLCDIVAIKTFVKYRMSISGAGKSFSQSTRLRRNLPETESKYLSSVAGLSIISKRLQSVGLYNRDFRQLIPVFDSPKTFFYQDPPYWGEERTTTKVYNLEFTEQDHRDLAAANYKLKGKFLLSCYYSKLYLELYPTSQFQWISKEVKAHSSHKVNKPKKVEVLIRNF